MQTEFRCKICDKVYGSKTDLNHHKERQHEEDSVDAFKCKLCDKGSSSKDTLEEHISSDHVEKIKCDLCVKGLPSKDALEDHISSHHDEMFWCQICQEGYSSKTTFEKHVTICEEANLQFKCVFCNVNFPSKTSLNEHFDSEHNAKKCDFQCDLCGKQFPLEKCVADHKKISHVTETVPKICRICKELFRNQKELSKHRLTCNEIKCEECGKLFDNVDVRKRHGDTVHSDTKFPCELCDTSCSTTVHLNRHVREVHSGKAGRKFKCDVSEKSFKRPDKLKEHKISRHSVGRSQCDTCKEFFKNAIRLDPSSC